MKKMKKACAVLLAVLSVSLLASAFAGEDPNDNNDKNNNNNVRWQNLVGNITVSNNDAVGILPGPLLGARPTEGLASI